MFQKILAEYNLNLNDISVIEFGTGLINNTWKISSRNDNRNYLLQRINHSIFKRPDYIAHNIRIISDYLIQNDPGYLFISPLKTSKGQDLIHDESGYFRLFPFLESSHSIDVVSSPSQAYEASKQFSLFTKLLSRFDISLLKTTLKDFHNLSLRYEQFKTALQNGNKERIKNSKGIILFLKENYSIVEIYEKIKNDPDFKLRVTHHDTKISNVLFNNMEKALCIIDLDTVMPGYFISDVGDMMRTYLCPVSEEEVDISKIIVRDEYFEAIAKGYLSNMNSELSSAEIDQFVYAGKFMVYMQALRFLTDYLNNDIYYLTRYPTQNLNRANNQVELLKKIIEKESLYTTIVKRFTS
ncbi:MAG: phosphotransferase enzyme family protein [Flavisolibacter sp.]